MIDIASVELIITATLSFTLGMAFMFAGLVSGAKKLDKIIKY